MYMFFLYLIQFTVLLAIVGGTVLAWFIAFAIWRGYIPLNVVDPDLDSDDE